MSATAPLIVFHLDLNFVNLRMDYLRRWLNKIAQMGYTAVLWEIENKVQWETCPECVWPEAMTKDEFRGLLDYSRSLGLEPIPLLQTIGHAEYVLQHEPYRSFRELPDRHDCYCTSNPKVRQFLLRWVKEYLALFGPLRHFHLGGDEAYVFGKCPDCQSRIAASSANVLYGEHLTAIAQPLLEAGLRPGIWGDMLLHYPKEMNVLPPEFVVWDWNYWDGYTAPLQTKVWHRKHSISKEEIVAEHIHETLPEVLDANGDIRPFHAADVLKRAGRDVVLCSASRASGESPFVPSHARHADNIVGAAVKTKTAGLVGHCVTSWALRLNSYETQELLFHLAPAAIVCGESARAVVDRVIPVALQESLNQISVMNTELLSLSAVQWNGLKDSLPAPAGHTAAVIARFESQKNKFWCNRFELLESALASIAAGLKSLDGESTPVAIAWRQAGQLHLRYYQALLLLIGRTPDRAAALAALTALKCDYAAYLETAQTPLSAQQNAGLVFDPLLEYAKSELS